MDSLIEKWEMLYKKEENEFEEILKKLISDFEPNQICQQLLKTKGKKKKRKEKKMKRRKNVNATRVE